MAARRDSLSKQGTYDRIARWYDFFDLPFEHFRYKPLRRVLFDGMRGALLDAGVGNGRNFPFYPDGSEVTGIDLSPPISGPPSRSCAGSADRAASSAYWNTPSRKTPCGASS